MSWKEGDVIEPDARLGHAELLRMSTQDMVEYFRPFMARYTEVLTVTMRRNYIHLFPSLHARRPSCGAELPFEPSNSTFSRRHATCRDCLGEAS